MPYLRRRNITSWNGRSSPETGSKATTSPSRITSRGPTLSPSSFTTSGNWVETRSRRRVYSSRAPSAVRWACTRMPSYLYSAAQSPPSLSRISAGSLSRWASIGRTGLPARTSIRSTAARPPPTRVAATSDRSEQML
jgi:hypothetical protein